MLLVCGTHEDERGQIIAQWFGAMIQKPIYGPYAAMGWLNHRDSLVAATIFNDYTGNSIEAHIYGPKGHNRQTLTEMLRYAFNQLGVEYLRAKPPRDKKQVQHMLRRLGFVHEGLLKHYYGPNKSDDAIVFRLDRGTAGRWIHG